MFSLRFLLQIGSSLPQFRHLFNTKPPILTLKGAITMLKPNFSEPGTNRRSLQTRVYSVFTKYLREVSSKNKIYTCRCYDFLCYKIELIFTTIYHTEF